LARSSRLLLMIGAAAALGSGLVGLARPEQWVTGLPHGVWAVVALFAIAASVKSLQGSSMVTFATVTAIVGPYLAATGLSDTAAVLAVCLGSIAVLLPNDSFYWLVRSDALRHEQEWEALKTLSVGSLIQASCGLCCLLFAVAAGWL
jgi:GntP family gluconate:H+ symporter